MTYSSRKPGQGGKWCRPATRMAIYHRDGFACVYCGAGGEKVVLTLDHILACELSGTNDPRNLVTACRTCNSSKSNRSVRAWYGALRARGVNVDTIQRRIRNATRRKLDRVEGRRLAALRKGE